MTQTNNTQIAEPLQLFIDLYNKSFGELVIPFTHRRLSFHASTILYYPQPSEYVANDRIKDAIVGNPEETIFSCISKTMRCQREEQQVKFKEHLDGFERDTGNFPSLTIRYCDTLVVPEGITLRQILAGLEDEKVEGIIRGLFPGYITKSKDKRDELRCGMAPDFAAVESACKDIYWSHTEWAKHFMDVSERYTLFLRPTILCIEDRVHRYCNNPQTARIIPIQNPLFDATSLRITGDEVRCDGLIQIISERDLKSASKGGKDYLFDDFQKALQIPAGILSNSHYEFGKSFVLEGILMKEDRITD